MKKIVSNFWQWLQRVFSMPKSETEISAPNVPSPTIPTSEVPTSEPKESKPRPKPKPSELPTTPAPTKGYNSHFLSAEIPLPQSEMVEKESILHYLHFSVAMNKKRKMPYFTAVNIDAIKYNKLKDQIPSRKEIGADTWIIDPRLDKTAQLPKTFYSNNDFDLGHMVRREDALWGDTLEEAIAANNDTFYLTNATPQHKDFNRNAERWKGLEDYALRSARQHDLKISVFTGCIFTDKDRRHASVRIPAKFWKVLVMIKDDGTPSATGYIVHQDDLIKDITEPGIFIFEQFKTYQTDLKSIEEATGLSFGLNSFDPLQKEGTRSLLGKKPELIDDFDKIVF